MKIRKMAKLYLAKVIIPTLRCSRGLTTKGLSRTGAESDAAPPCLGGRVLSPWGILQYFDAPNFEIFPEGGRHSFQGRRHAREAAYLGVLKGVPVALSGKYFKNFRVVLRRRETRS
jgi:hypothetical protein